MNNLSADTKDALARDFPAQAHCREALLAGLALYGTRSIGKRAYFVTHRNAVARLFLKLSPRDARYARSSTTKAAQRIAIPVEAQRAPKPSRRCDRVMEARAA